MKRILSGLGGLAFLLLLGAPLATAQTITTGVGTGVAGSTGDGSPAAAATLNLPYRVATDAVGNLFIAERAGHRIRRVDAATGDITTIAGTGVAGFSGDGAAATAAQLNNPNDVAVDPANGDLIIADTGNHRVRRVDVATGDITTVAGDGTPGNTGDTGPGVAAQLDSPFGVVVLANGDVLITDQNNNRIRCLLAVNSDIVAFAGTGVAGFSGDGAQGLLARMRQPRGITRDAAGDIFFTDTDNHRIRRISSGVITTVAGNGTAGFSGDGGTAITAQLNFPHGIAVHPDGSLLIADSTNNRVRLVGTNGNISTFAGTGTAGSTGDGGPAPLAQLRAPFGLAFDSNTNLFVADRDNHKVRRITPAPTGVAPVITTQPLSASLATGGSVSLNVTASGAPSPTFQWFFTNGPIPGATLPTLTFNPAQVTNSGTYFVVVTNTVGSVTSTVVTLTITNSTAPPAITTQPLNQTVFRSNNVTFAVSANGALPLAYQWFFNSNVLGGATSPSLARNNVQTNAEGSYFVIVTNSFGSITSSIATLTVLTNSQAPPYQWAQNFGGTGNDSATVVAVDNSGNMVVAGTFSGSISFGTTNLTALGTTDAFVAKFDTNGVCQWVRRVGGVGATAAGYGVAVDALGNVIVHSDLTGTASFGSTNITTPGIGSVFVAKYDPAGTLQWVNSYSGQAGTGSRRVATDLAGNIFLGGNFNGSGPVGGTVTFGTNVLASAGMDDAYLVKLSPAGSVLWARQQGGPGQDGGVSVAVDPSGNCYTTFSLAGTMTLGTNSFVASGPSDTILAKYDANGALIWARQSGGSGNDFPQELTGDANGNAFVIGEFGGVAGFGPFTLTSAGGQDAFVAKYDPNGNAIFAKSFGGTAADSGLGVGVDASGFIYLHGNFRGTFFAGALSVTNATGGQSAFTVKLDAAGNPVWLKSADSSGTVVGKNLAVSAGGNAFVVGNYNASTTFAPFTLTNAGQQDFYFAKIPASVGPVPVPTGVVGWWAGDGFAVDYAWTNHGSFISGATTSAGKVGAAFDLNGASQLISIPPSPFWVFGTNSFTVELWANFRATNVTGDLIGFDSGLGNDQPKWFFRYQANGTLTFHVNGPGLGGGVFLATVPYSPSTNQWHHLAVQRSGTTFTLFADGLPLSSQTSTVTISDAGSNLTIGWAEGSSFFNGQLDEVSIYNRALAPTEIQSIVAAGTSGKARPAAPTILAQPQALTVDQGAPVSLGVAAAGYAPLAYQWRLNGTNVPGQTNSALTIPAAYSVHEGSYDVRITQLDSVAVTSAAATLNVLGQGEAKTLFATNSDVGNFIRVGGGAVPWTLTSSNTLLVVPGTGSIQSTQSFGDFILHAEFRCPSPTDAANGNSGIYLQNRYEIQIFNSFGVTVPGGNDIGAVWNQTPASVNAALPAGQWQTYDITFRQAQWNGNTKVANARVTVVLNGVTVQNETIITGPTAGGMAEGPTPGPVVLQDNGSTVQFRNIRITPLDLAPEFQRALSVGGTQDDSLLFQSRDASGSAYLSGSFQGTTTIGTNVLVSSGLFDAYIAKVSPSGSVLWARTVGGTGDESGFGVAAVANGDVFFCGRFQNTASFGTTNLTASGVGDLFLARYDRNGNLIWARKAGGAGDDAAYAVAADAAGNAYVSGEFNGTTDLGGIQFVSGSAPGNGFVAKYGPTGALVWASALGGTGTPTARKIRLDGATNVYVAGSFQGTVQFVTPFLSSAGSDDAYVLKLNSAGAAQWAQQFGAGGSDAISALDLGLDGSVHVAGNFRGSVAFGTNTLNNVGGADVFTAKLDPAGNVLWARQAGGGGTDGASSVGVDAQGNVFVAGSFNNAATFSATPLANSGASDLFVVHYDANGIQRWVRRSSSGQNITGTELATDFTGGILVSGEFLGSLALDATPLSSLGQRDIFHARIASIPPVISQQPIGGNVLAGQNSTFTVGATGTGGVTYQWRLNGTNLAGATNAAYTIVNATTNAAGTYDVLVTHAFGSIASTPAVVTVTPSSNPLPFTAAVRLGGTGADSVQALARDAAGNSYLAGFFTGTLALGTTNLVSAGGDDIFVAKVSPAGTVLWAAQCGGPGEDRATGLALDPNGDVVVVGWFNNNAVFGTNGAISIAVNLAAFTLRLSTDGVLTGFHKIEDNGVTANAGKERNFAVAVDASGFVYVAGAADRTNFFGSVLFGRPEIYGYLVKYDRAGNVQWIQASDRAPGTSQNVVGMAVAIDNAGGVFLGGFYGQPGATYTNAIIGGVTLPYGGGDADAFVAKFTAATGAPVWTRGLNGPGAERVMRLATDAFGNVFASGDFDAAVNFGPGVLTPSNGSAGTGLLLKLNAAGTVLWAREAGGTDGLTRDNGALATDVIGNVYLANNYTGTGLLGTPSVTSLGGRDALVTKFSAGGNFLWAQTFGSTSDDFVNGLVLDANSNLHIAGTLGGQAALGPFTLTHAGSSDLFLATITSQPPVISTQPASQNIGVTQPVTFSVAATGTLPVSYQWRFNGTNIVGATNSAFTIASVVPGSAGGYSVLVGDALGIATSATATLTVDTSGVPFITVQPQSLTVLQGTASLLSVTAVGAPPLSYQWRRNGTNLAGEVFDILPLGSTTNANGTYTVVVTNVFGAVTSAPAVLTVTPIFPPVITNQPVSITVLAGSNATFSVAASGTAPFSYQWVRGGVALPGNDAPTLTVTNATLADAGNYFVQVFNSVGLVTSAFATLTVNAPPVFLSLPQPATVLQGATTNFAATASGMPAPAFAWFRDGVRLTNSAGYSGVSTTNLLVLGAQGAQAGGYYVIATNVAGSITSAPVSLTVLLAPTITTHPTDVTLFRASSNYAALMPVTLSVAATGAAPLFYQWRFNGGDLAGETNTTFTLTNVTRLSNGVYQAVVTNIAGSAASSNALVRVRVAQRVEPPVFTPGAPFRLRFTDDNGEQASAVDLAKIEVQAATNLLGTNTAWVTLTNGFSVVGGMLQLDDSSITNSLRRYYRVIEK